MAFSDYISGSASIWVDTSSLNATILRLRGMMNEQKFSRLLHRTFNEVGKHAAVLIAKDVTQDYSVTQKWVKGEVGKYQLEISGANVKCTIPISGHKGSIGGRFHARQLKKGSISANVVKSGVSHLPPKMANQGGNPPFMIHGVAFTRKTQERLPIVRVVGLGVPQMPMNRSREEVAKDILDYAHKRLEHNFMYMMNRGAL